MGEKNNKTLKNIGLYLSITIIVIISIIVACVVYLFVYPEGNIFGFTYAEAKNTEIYNAKLYDAKDILGIQIETKTYDVSLEISDKNENIRAYVYNNSSGYVKKSNLKVGFEIVENPETNILELSTIELSGLMLKNDSSVRVIVPKMFFDTGNFDVAIKTGKKSAVTISGDADYQSKIDALDLSVNRGKIFIDDVEIKTAHIKANRSTISAGANLVGEIELLKLDIGNSKLDFLYAGDAETEYKKTEQNWDNINFNIKKLELIGARKKADIKILKCDMAVTGENVEIEAGNLKIYQLQYMMDIVSKNFNVDIGRIIGDGERLVSRFTSSGTGKVEVSESSAPCTFITNKGDVGISHALNSMNVESNSGNIVIQKATKSLSVVNDSGSVFIAFDESLEDYNIDNNLRKIDLLRVVSSSVSIYGVDNINVQSDKFANISIHYHKLLMENSFEIKQSKLNVTVPTGGSVKLLIVGNETLVGADVGVFKRDKSMLYKDEIIEEFIYSSDSENVLSINALEGEIEIFSEDLV